MEAGPSLFDSEAADSQKMLRGSHYLVSLLSSELTEAQKGFPLAPFLSVAPFCSDDAGKLALCGAGFSGSAFFAADGFSLRKQEASLPGFPKASAGMPDAAWLPSWLASCINALIKPAEKESLLAFHWPERMECQALRFWLPSGICAAFRFSKAADFPNYQKLIPSELPYAFTADRKAFLSMVSGLLQSLKAYDGQPRIDFYFDAPIGTVEASVTLQRNTGTKQKPDLEKVGIQEASITAFYSGFHGDPAFDDGFFDLPETQRDVAHRKFAIESKLCCNAFFLEKALKSFKEDRICFQWSNGVSPFIVSNGSPGSLALIMPVQKRN